MGGCQEERETNPTPELPLILSKAHFHPSPIRPNMLTSPLHTLASVPFCWEEEPGKPKHRTNATSLAAHDYIKCLELPPRLLFTGDAKEITKLSRRFESSSFRMMVLGSDCYGSFRSNFSPDHGDKEEQQLGALLLAGKRGGYDGGSGFWWFWKRKKGSKGKREAVGGSYVFPSSSSVVRESEYRREGEKDIIVGSTSTNVRITRTSRAGSPYALSAPRSHFWETMFAGLKQVVPRKSKKIER